MLMEGKTAPEQLERIQAQIGGEIKDGTVGTFVRLKVYNEKLSAEAEEPVYILHDYCDVRVPGNVNAGHRELVRKIYPDGKEIIASEPHIQKYGLAWDAFLRGEDLTPDGTLLEECPGIPKERIQALRAANVQTVEELIQIPDRALQRIGPDGRALQRAAMDWLKDNDRAAEALTKLEDQAKELAELRAKLAEIEDRNNDDDNTGQPPKRGGRGRRRDP